VSKLTGVQRKRLSLRTFAVPSRRAFPIPDKAHARQALRMIGYAHSNYEKANIRRKANAMLGK
jgi:hypothetical protein